MGWECDQRRDVWTLVAKPALVAIALTAGTSALGSCQRFVDLPDLQAVSEIQLPDFRQRNLAYAEDRAFGSYVLRSADLIELHWHDASRQSHGMEVLSNQCTDVGCQPCRSVGIPSGDVIFEGMTPRLSVAVLASVSGVLMRDPDTGGTDPLSEKARTVDFCKAGYSPLEPGRRLTWAAFAGLFAGKAIRPRLLIEHPQRVLPGDLVRVTILSKFGTGGDPTPRPYQATQAENRVDERGELFVPALSTAAELSREGPVTRRAVAAIDDAAFRVQLWRMGVGFGEQITLQYASACLSAAWTREEATTAPLSATLAREAKRCLSAGIEGPVFRSSNPADEDNTRVRYRLEVDQTWSLVDEEGRRFEQRYIPGETIATAVLRVSRDVEGRELVGTSGLGRGQAYIAVIPRSELGPGLNSRPFFGVIAATRPSMLETILLAPGDVIHVTRRPPTLRQ
jgi:hypothetical protein